MMKVINGPKLCLLGAFNIFDEKYHGETSVTLIIANFFEKVPKMFTKDAK